MVEWQPTQADAFVSTHIRLSELTSSKLSELGLPLEDGSFPLNASTAHLWIRCLGDLLITAKALCQNKDSVSLKNLTNHLLYIDEILGCPEIRDVFRRTRSLSHVFISTCIHNGHTTCSAFSTKTLLLQERSRAQVVEEADAEESGEQSDEELGEPPDSTLCLNSPFIVAL